jgi:large subunit ribosomal protein L9
MEVILLEKVENLGGIGDKVKVRPGYGRNYLIPQGKATAATEAHLAAFEARRAELEAKAAEELAAAEARAEKVRELKLVIHAKAGEEGKLFGSVGTVDIAEAATAAGVELERSEVRLHDGPIRVLGEHTVEIHLHADVSVELPLTVAVEEGAAEQE